MTASRKRYSGVYIKDRELIATLSNTSEPPLFETQADLYKSRVDEEIYIFNLFSDRDKFKQ